MDVFEEWLWLRVVGSRGPAGDSGEKPGEVGRGTTSQLGMRDAVKPSWKAGFGVARADQRPEDGGGRCREEDPGFGG